MTWLLWLALLLPMAQSAALWHGVSHGAESARSEQKQAPGLAHCDLCLSAAALHGGALPSLAPALPPVHAGHAAPRVDVASVWLAPPPRAYLSRAPPFAVI